MTEEEAKTKWCPFVRCGAGEVGLNRYRDTDKSSIANASRCIASGCMVWRWNVERWTELSGSGTAVVQREQRLLTGYCGLAGAQ